MGRAVYPNTGWPPSLAVFGLSCRTPGAAAPAADEPRRLGLHLAGQHATVARAVIYALTPRAVTVSLKKPLRRGLLLPAEMASGTPTTASQQQQQAAAGASARAGSSGTAVQQAAAASGPAPMAVDSAAPPAGLGAVLEGAGRAPAAAPGPEFDGGVRWRLDRDDVSSTFVKLRFNLFSLFRPEDDRAERLRQLIVGLAPPEWAPQVLRVLRAGRWGGLQWRCEELPCS
jgi:hypothetical protein